MSSVIADIEAMKSGRPNVNLDKDFIVENEGQSTSKGKDCKAKRNTAEKQDYTAKNVNETYMIVRQMQDTLSSLVQKVDEMNGRMKRMERLIPAISAAANPDIASGRIKHNIFDE